MALLFNDNGSIVLQYNGYREWQCIYCSPQYNGSPKTMGLLYYNTKDLLFPDPLGTRSLEEHNHPWVLGEWVWNKGSVVLLVSVGGLCPLGDIISHENKDKGPIVLLIQWIPINILFPGAFWWMTWECLLTVINYKKERRRKMNEWTEVTSSPWNVFDLHGANG